MLSRLSWSGPLWCALLVLTFALCDPCQAAEAAELDEVRRQREVAVELARSGELDRAIEILRSLHDRHPGEAEIGWDLVTVLSWADRHGEAVEQAETLPLEEAPAYVVEAVARSYRLTGRPERAVELYEQLQESHPGSSSVRAGKALALQSLGRSEAADLAEAILDDQEADLESLLAAARIFREIQRPVESIRAVQRVLAEDPDHREGQRLRTLLAIELGAPFRAEEFAQEEPILVPEERAWLEGGLAAQKVRWGALEPPDPSQRFRETDEAIRRLREQIATLPPGADQRLRARFDLLIALRDRVLMQEVVEEYESLDREGMEVPFYAREAAADAYLHLRRPERALELYRGVLEENPDHFGARQGIYYALLESERVEEALEWAREIERAEETWRRHPGLETPQENWEKHSAHVLVGRALLFADKPRQARDHLEPLVAEAPASVELRSALAASYRALGWSHAALEQYDLVLALDPEFVPARIGRLGTLMDLRRWRQVRVELDSLRTAYPENLHVQSLVDAWERQHGWELTLEAVGGESDDGAVSELGSEDLLLEAHLFAPPFGHRGRMFAHYYRFRADFPEGEGEHERVGLGLQWQGDRADYWIEAHGDVGPETNPNDEDDVGLVASISLHPGDHWTTGVGVQIDSYEVPLRARRAGIDGDRFEVFTRWQPNARARLGLSLALLDMSDDNQRISALLSGERRLKTTADGWAFDGGFELYGSTNDREDAPYFNPDEDAAFLLTAVNHWRGWRRYERSLTHRLVLQGGAYWQQEFGTDPILIARYEHEWSTPAVYSLRYGVGWSSRVYDGDREERTWLYFGFGGRTR